MRSWIIVAAMAACSCSPAHATDDRPKNVAPAAAPAQPAPVPGKQAVEVEMSQVNLHVTADMTLGGDHSNVEKVRISIDEEHQLQQKGVLKKGAPLPFNVKGGIEATPDGRLRMHAAKVKSAGVPVNPLMKLLSIEMDDLVKVKPGYGVTVDGNDLILDPQLLLPPPLIRGKVSSVRVEDAAIVLSFGSGERVRLSPPAVSKHYIYWRGGELQFGKLLMTNTYLELVDEDANDPFDFSVDHWNDQLVAGYSKTRPNRGLKAHMPDYNDLASLRLGPTSMQAPPR